MRAAIGPMIPPNAPIASCRYGTKTAARMASTPMTTVALVADEVRIEPAVPRASASSSVERASDRARPDAATTSRASPANGVRSIVPGPSTAMPMAIAASGIALRASVHRVAPRAIDTMRQR